MLMSSRSRVARLAFMPNGFRILANGDHVLCAMSGEAIAIEELRYWSVDRQEAYAGPAEALRALHGGADRV